jgi:hypothetical protein
MPELAEAAAQYEERCAEANATLYRAVKAAVTSEQLEAAYAAHTEARNEALQEYADARRRLIGHG